MPTMCYSIITERQREVNTMYDYDREIRLERAREAKREKQMLSVRGWQYHTEGARDPHYASMDTIMAAYNDAYATDNYYNYY